MFFYYFEVWNSIKGFETDCTSAMCLEQGVEELKPLQPDVERYLIYVGF